MKHTITLQDIRNKRPCEEGWTTLLRALGYANGKFDAGRTVTLGDIAKSNGAQDALWSARCLTPEAGRDLVRAILPSVKRATAAATDTRILSCVSAVEAWIGGADVDLSAAAEAAWSAWSARSAEARAAAWSARAAAAWSARAAAAAAEAAAARSAEARAAAAAEAAARSAAWSAWSAAAARSAAARSAELDQQVADIIAVFGLSGEAA